jgi:excisionase family DNA binding protein
VPTTSGRLLTTGEVAALLRSSRQHVVDLCDQGVLPAIRVGSHRRIRQEDVEVLLRPSQQLTRDQLKALWLHRAVAGSLVTNPDEVLDKARANLDRLLRQHQNTMTEMWLRRWQDTIDAGAEAVLEVLTSQDSDAVEMRQNSPFAGVLSEPQRLQVLDSFRRRGWNRAA